MVPEHHSRTVNYTVNQPVMRSVSQSYVVQVPEPRTRTEHYTVNVPELKTHQVKHAVMVPYTKAMTGTRPVYKMVPCKVTKEICEDMGCWQSVPCESPKCGTCDEAKTDCNSNPGTCLNDKRNIQRISHEWSEESGYAYGSCYGNCDGGFAGYPVNPSLYDGGSYGPGGHTFGAALPLGFEYPVSPLRAHLRHTRAHIREHLPVVGLLKDTVKDGAILAIDCFRGFEGALKGPGGVLGHHHHCFGCDSGCHHCPAQACETGCPSDCNEVCKPDCKRIWVSKVVKREVCETYWKTTMSKEDYTYYVTCYRPETRTQTVCTTHYRPQIRTREVGYTVMRPEVRTCQRLVTDWIPRTFTQEVPYTVVRPETRTRMVTTCTMIPQVRTRTVPYVTFRSETRTHMVNVTTCTYQTRSRIVPYCVMRPETRERTVFVTNFINQPYTVNVPYVTHKPEKRTHTVYQTLYRQVARSRDVPHTTYETITKNATRCEVVYKKVPYESKETYTCQVPYEVDVEVSVPVVRVKTVQDIVPQICPCEPCTMGPCEPCDDHGCFLRCLFD